MINFANWIKLKINEEESGGGVAPSPPSPPPSPSPSPSPDQTKSDPHNGTMSSDIAKRPFRLGCCGFGCYSFGNFIKRKKKRKKRKNK